MPAEISLRHKGDEDGIQSAIFQQRDQRLFAGRGFNSSRLTKSLSAAGVSRRAGTSRSVCAGKRWPLYLVTGAFGTLCFNDIGCTWNCCRCTHWSKKQAVYSAQYLPTGRSSGGACGRRRQPDLSLARLFLTRSSVGTEDLVGYFGLILVRSSLLYLPSSSGNQSDGADPVPLLHIIARSLPAFAYSADGSVALLITFHSGYWMVDENR